MRRVRGVGLKRRPVTVLTGFLGAGKTTTILNLLKYKPANERWAILVNEFGETYKAYQAKKPMLIPFTK